MTNQFHDFTFQCALPFSTRFYYFLFYSVVSLFTFAEVFFLSFRLFLFIYEEASCFIFHVYYYVTLFTPFKRNVSLEISDGFLLFFSSICFICSSKCYLFIFVQNIFFYTLQANECSVSWINLFLNCITLKHYTAIIFFVYGCSVILFFDEFFCSEYIIL